jgi:hypothetical protein
MTQQKKKNALAFDNFGQYAAQRGRDLLRYSSARQVVIRMGGGRKLVELNMTVALIVLGLALLLPFALPLLALLFIAGFVGKLRLEVIHDVDDDNNLIDAEQIDL